MSIMLKVHCGKTGLNTTNEQFFDSSTDSYFLTVLPADEESLTTADHLLVRALRGDLPGKYTQDNY